MQLPIKCIAIGVLALSLAAIGASTQAQQAGPKPESLIKWRQSAFSLIGWNTGRIKASVEGTFNKEEVVKAANTIAAISGSGLDKLFAPGSEQGKGWHDTAAKPELFKDVKHFNDLNAALGKEALELASVANGGDPAALKTQFGKLTKTCKTCHDDFKVKE
jgi:cytochrome c556